MKLKRDETVVVTSYENYIRQRIVKKSCSGRNPLSDLTNNKRKSDLSPESGKKIIRLALTSTVTGIESAVTEKAIVHDTAAALTVTTAMSFDSELFQHPEENESQATNTADQDNFDSELLEHSENESQATITADHNTFDPELFQRPEENELEAINANPTLLENYGWKKE